MKAQEQEQEQKQAPLLPPLFDDITDEELSMTSSEIAELIQKINRLREKQLHGGGLTNEEVKEGISLLNELRIARAGKSASAEKSAPLESLF